MCEWQQQPLHCACRREKGAIYNSVILPHDHFFSLLPPFSLHLWPTLLLSLFPQLGTPRTTPHYPGSHTTAESLPWQLQSQTKQDAELSRLLVNVAWEERRKQALYLIPLWKAGTDPADVWPGSPDARPSWTPTLQEAGRTPAPSDCHRSEGTGLAGMNQVGKGCKKAKRHHPTPFVCRWRWSQLHSLSFLLTPRIPCGYPTMKFTSEYTETGKNKGFYKQGVEVRICPASYLWDIHNLMIPLKGIGGLKLAVLHQLTPPILCGTYFSSYLRKPYFQCIIYIL